MLEHGHPAAHLAQVVPPPAIPLVVQGRPTGLAGAGEYTPLLEPAHHPRRVAVEPPPCRAGRTRCCPAEPGVIRIDRADVIVSHAHVAEPAAPGTSPGTRSSSQQ